MHHSPYNKLPPNYTRGSRCMLRRRLFNGSLLTSITQFHHSITIPQPTNGLYKTCCRVVLRFNCSIKRNLRAPNCGCNFSYVFCGGARSCVFLRTLRDLTPRGGLYTELSIVCACKNTLRIYATRSNGYGFQ